VSGGGGGKEQAPIIIKKIKKGGDGHHGGAWKVAYADFVTAMMAFFLLLWLLNVTTSEQKMGIADYFSPASMSRTTSGAGGILGGQTITVPGAQVNASTPPTIDAPVEPTPGGVDGEEPVEGAGTGADGQPENQGRRDGDAGGDANGKGPGTSEGAGQGSAGSAQEDSYLRGIAQLDRMNARQAADANQDGLISEQELADALARQEQQRFDQAVASLKQAIQAVPELEKLQDSLLIDMTPEGLRLQLVDQEGYSMFPSGSSRMFPQTAQLLAAVAQAVTNTENRLSISGHTDSTPFTGSSYGNWELSTDRANAARRALEAAGIDPSRIETVVGKADREHLFTDDPNSPRNRRISIVLIREQNPPAAP